MILKGCRTLALASVLIATALSAQAQSQQSPMTSAPLPAPTQAAPQAASPPTAAAPQAPAGPPQSPVCARLENQLQTFERANNDGGRIEQLRRYEETAGKQQAELDRQEANGRRAGCERTGFFVMLTSPPAQCGPINTKIQQMRDNIEKLTADIERLRAGAPQEAEGQRRTLLAALSQNSCGAQYRQALAQPVQQRQGLFESLFGPRSQESPQESVVPTEAPNAFPTGSYRTICVRTCDGFFYPISPSTTPARFADDEKTCRASCPASETQLYSHRVDGQGINDAVSVTNQQPYTQSPNAFKYRTSLDQSCSCRRAGETWSQALQNTQDPTAVQGDIVVNDQRAKQMSQPKVDAQGKPIRQAPSPTPARADARTPAVTGAVAPAAAPAEAEASKSDEGPSKPDPNRKVRSVGPTFLPGK